MHNAISLSAVKVSARTLLESSSLGFMHLFILQLCFWAQNYKSTSSQTSN